jgi:hypothetical protein
VQFQRVMLASNMQLRREHIEAFQKAYKHDVGEDLAYDEAFEMVDRLVNIFLILEKAEQKLAHNHNEPFDDGDI